MVVTTAVGVELASASSSGPATTPGGGPTGAIGPQQPVRVPQLATISVGSATYLGAVPAGSTANIEVVLAPSNTQQLAQLVSEVSSPTSSLYHDFLTEPQFVADFGPAPAVVSQAESWLSSGGLTVSHPSPFVIAAHGSSQSVSGLMGVQFGRYSAAGGLPG